MKFIGFVYTHDVGLKRIMKFVGFIYYTHDVGIKRIMKSLYSDQTDIQNVQMLVLAFIIIEANLYRRI